MPPTPSAPLVTVLATRALAFSLVAAACVSGGQPADNGAATTPVQTLQWDFEKGEAGGWAGFNSSVTVSDEIAHEGSKRALRVDAGQWGANFQLESPDLARTRALRLYVWCDLAAGESAAWPQLHVNGANTNQWVGPRQDGSLAGVGGKRSAST